MLQVAMGLRMRGRRVAGWLAVAGLWLLVLPAVGAYETNVAAPLPPGFDVKPRGGPAERVVYAESSGEFLNGIFRKIIEPQCRASIDMGLASRMPSFEAGAELPSPVERWSYTNERHAAVYSLDHPYACDRPEVVKLPGALCNCTFRRLEVRKARIRNVVPEGVEILDIDFDKRSATRRLLPGMTRLEPVAAGDDASRAWLVGGLAPEVMGRERIQGMDCVVRRRTLGAGGYMEWCITEDEAKVLPPALRQRALRDVMHTPDPDRPAVWRNQTDRIVLESAIDAAVFEVPAGFDVKAR